MKRTLILVLCIVSFSYAKGQKQLLNATINEESPVNIASEEIKKSFTPAPEVFNQLKSGKIKKSNFEVVFVNFPEEAKTAFWYATSIWESVISSTIPVKVLAIWEPIENGYLAKGRPALNYKNFEGALVPNVYYPISLVEKLSGVEMNGNEPDIICSFNPNIPWYFGTDGNTPTTKYDFTTAVIHEITHGLGFSGFLKTDSKSGYFNNSSNVPSIFDFYIYNNSLQKIADNTLFKSPSTELKSQLISENLISFNPHDKISNENSMAKIFAPKTWLEGSSIYHLDGTGTELLENVGAMTATAFKGKAVHTPGNKTIEILSKIGWKSITFQFNELKDIELVTGAQIPVGMTINNDLPLDTSSVKIIFSVNNFSTTDSAKLTVNKVSNQFEGSIPVNFSLGRVQYCFKAVSSEGQVFTLPSQAAEKKFSFRIGPDYYAPAILHNPEKIISQSAPTINLKAFVCDNVGINSVKVEYRIDGITHEPLVLRNDSADCFAGKLQIPANLAYSKVEYRIIAEDNSSNKNKKTSPASGFYTVNKFETQKPVSGYFSDFNTETTDIMSSDFNVSNQAGNLSGKYY